MKLLVVIIYLIYANVVSAEVYIGADTTKSIKIDSVKIVGNKTTEEFVILRELDFKTGDFISQSQLNYNQERIYSLGIFNRVELFIETSRENYNILTIRVTESWYIYPLPYLVLRENSFKRSSYGLGILYKNFRGRNETLWGLITFGYDPTYMLYYYNPVLFTGQKFTLGVSTGYTNLDNRNILSETLNGNHFRYNYVYGSIALGYRIDQFNHIQQITSYEYVEMPDKIAELSASKKNIDKIFSMGLSYEYDNRNLKQFSNNGFYGKLDIIHEGFGINNISYNVFNLDLRKYNFLLGDLAAKWRGLFRSTFGTSIPFYALSLLGDKEYIRGHRFDKREGNNYFLTSFEINYPIIKEWNISLDLPLLPRNLTSARIGFYANLFLDSGTTFNNGEAPSIQSFDTGWGFGFTLLILPYNAIRFEYGFNEFKVGEFIFETGFSF